LFTKRKEKIDLQRFFFLKSEIEKSAIQLHKKYIYVESLIKFPIWEIVFFLALYEFWSREVMVARDGLVE